MLSKSRCRARPGLNPSLGQATPSWSLNLFLCSEGLGDLDHLRVTFLRKILGSTVNIPFMGQRQGKFPSQILGEICQLRQVIT